MQKLVARSCFTMRMCVCAVSMRGAKFSLLHVCAFCDGDCKVALVDVESALPYTWISF